MSGVFSFLFLLLVTWLLLYCIHAFLRLVGESLFGNAGEAASGKPVTGRLGASRDCSNPHCRNENRANARFCAKCGEPLTGRREPAANPSC